MDDTSPVGRGFWRVASSADLFAGVDGAVRDALAAGARRASYRAGELVAGAGAEIEQVYVVESGRLRVSVADERGGAVEIARPGPGEYCGELPLIRHADAGTRIEAIDDSVAWAVPHALLAELAERSPQLARGFASRIACRASDTDRRLGRTRARGRMAGAVSFGDPGWAAALLARTALSASRVLQRSVLLVDLTDATAVPTYAHELPSLTDLLSQPAQFAAHDAFASGAGARVGVARLGQGRELSRAVVIDMLTELAGRYPLVIAHVSMTCPARTALAAVADTTVAIGLDGQLEVVRRARLPGERDVIVLAEGATPDTEGERRRLGEICRAHVLRVVPGGPMPLVRNGDGAGEPWQSIDWLARHFLQRKIGLALGSGGVKGYAHVGVLAGLEAAGIPIDFLAGTSIGAPLAAGAALGAPSAELRAHLDGVFRQLTGPRMPWGHSPRAVVLRAAIDRLCRGQTFEALRTPLAIVAADLDRSTEYVFREGALADAVSAAGASPALCPPVVHDGRRLVDGAVVNPVPAGTVAAAGADVVLGVVLSPPTDRPERRARRWSPFAPSNDEAVLEAFDVMQWKLTAESVTRADVSIEPAFDGATGLADWRRAGAFIEAGRGAVEEALPRLRARLALPDHMRADALAA